MRVPSQFLEHSRRHNLLILCREVLADLETPLSAYMKLCCHEPSSFLLESVEGQTHVARYSFLGCRPLATFVFGNGQGTVYANSELGPSTEPDDILTAWRGLPGRPGDPLDQLRDLIQSFNAAPPILLRGEANGLRLELLPPESTPRFLGGVVGYLAYDTVRSWERLPTPPPDTLALPDAMFMVPKLTAAFDRLSHRLILAVAVQPTHHPEEAYREALAILDDATERLKQPVPQLPTPMASEPKTSPQPQMSAGQFTEAVRRIKEYIAAGDAFQVVFSQRFEVPRVRAHPLNIYRALRTINPSPYMFFLSFGNLKLIGSSPEMMVRVEGDTVEARPIAGTVPRGATSEEDQQLEAALLADEKERAEHLMLVDLARNDLGRICAYGTVEVTDFMRVERYSHVMHLVSQVRGRLGPGHDALSALRACFPAGTLAGAPKVRAMEIIDELEPTRRGPYGGAVGYLSFSGNLDSCIAIRTIVLKGHHAFVQAGAGIVADSDPQREYRETLHKAQAVLRALEMAEERLP